MGERGVWSWDLSEIAERSFTDNVVELMTGRISALEGATARALQLAACIGSRFGLQRLAAVLEVEPAAAATTLWPAIEAELVVPLDDSYRLMQTEAAGDLDPRYRFAHDRVQQAAHDLLSEGDRAATHLQLARAELDAGELQDEGLFSIATHANFGAAQVVETSERARYARLNLQAGRKAKRSAAFEPALRYLLAGRAFLADPWGGDGYPLAFELAEIHYLVGEHEAAEALFAELLEHSTEALDRARIFNLKLVLYGNTGRYPEAIDCAVQALAHCGERFSARPGKAGLSLELLRTLRLLRGKTPEGLQDLQELSEPRYLVALDVLNNLSGPAYFHDADLFSVLALRLLNITLKHGNSAVSAYGYGLYAMIAGSVLGNYELGQRFSELAATIDARYDNVDLRAKLGLIRGGLVNHWRNPIRSSYEILKRGYREGRVSGDLLYSGYCAACVLYCMVAAGEPLDEVFRHSERYNEFLQRTKDFEAAQTFVVEQRMVLHLQGQTESNDSFGSADFSEKDFVRHLESINMKIPLSLYRIVKMRALWLFGHWARALEEADGAAAVADASFGLPFSADYDFYLALTVLQYRDRMPAGVRRRRMRQARKAMKRMAKWAQNSPANFEHKHALLLAERARVEGDESAALRHYDHAIAHARKNQFRQDEAIACELAALHHIAEGRKRMARAYLRDACYAYGRWGATAKVEQLEAEFPELRRAMEQGTTSVSISAESTAGDALDFHTVFKAAQAMSSEIVLERLLEVMMGIVLENAGAQRGVLLLTSPDGLRVQAQGPDAAGEFVTLQDLPLAEAEVAGSVVAWVQRTESSLVLQDAAESPEHAGDPYVRAQAPKSVLCAPVMGAGQLVGVLYLENNLSAGAFTRDRLETMTLLTSQIAISIDNARLYSHQEKMAQSFARFVPTQFLELLGHTELLELGLGEAVEREISVLFSDIRGFTSLSEGMTPEENFTFLNRYLSDVAPVIRQHGGFIDKYIGDAIMALFAGEPVEALRGAIGLQRNLEAFNEGRLAAGEAPIEIGVGLHTGRVMLGTIGEAERLEGTVISDAVNTASRLEGLTKIYGAPVVVSGATLERINNPDLFAHRFLAQVVPRGRQQAIDIHEVFESDPPALRGLKLETRAAFERGVRHHLAGAHAEATVAFGEVLERNPADRAARHYLSLGG